MHSSATLRAFTPAGATPQVHQQDEPYNKLVSINWSDICAVPGQGDRFKIDVDRVVLFDTPARLKVRSHVWSYVGEQLGIPLPPALTSYGKKKRNIVITGVGGNGKSHNVMLLVKELRDKGHVVVYVHDIECLLDNPWDVILRELLFGLRQAKLDTEIIDGGPSSTNTS
jgi:Cdc6-like AAA superfamily ATPase